VQSSPIAKRTDFTPNTQSQFLQQNQHP